MRELYIEGLAIHDDPNHAWMLVRASAKRWKGHVQAGLLPIVRCRPTGQGQRCASRLNVGQAGGRNPLCVRGFHAASFS